MSENKKVVGNRSDRTQHRRGFLKGSLAAAGLVGLGFHTQASAMPSKMANEKLDLAIVGVANRARANINGVKHENIVAICDVDLNFLNRAAKDFSTAKKFRDYRKMLDNSKMYDAVVVSTPDHHHAHPSAWAMQLGKHCYCEKPLSHSVWEARQLQQLAKKNKVVTQMGTQIHATDNYRRVVELVQSGAIGSVKKVHVWVGKGWGGGDRPKKTDPVPAHLDWDLWLGPAPDRPYKDGRYHAAQWRRWWDFGGGTLGDMACHYMDLPFWALNLTHPTSVKAEGPAVHAETCPLGLKVLYQFPKVGNRDAVQLQWYDGNMIPKEVEGHKFGGNGVLFVGDKGMLYSTYGSHKLLPVNSFKEFKAPEQSIPKSVGHHQEFINACKTGSPTTCNFAYSGRLTESVLLGNVAYRVGKEIQWDAENLKVLGNEEAQKLIRRRYRKGWEFPS